MSSPEETDKNFSDLAEALSIHNDAIEALRKVAMIHMDRFSAISAFVDITTNSVKTLGENLSKLHESVLSLADLVERLEHRISGLETGGAYAKWKVD